MSQWLSSMLTKHRRKGILVDTNILLLLLVGISDRRLITRFKRTADRFALEDYDTLRQLLAPFSKILTTPHVLTEVSNFIGQLGEPARTDCRRHLASGSIQLEEHYTVFTELVTRPAHLKLGLTDAAVESLARRHLVLTDDFALAGALQRAGVDVINFNHIRTAGWQ